MKTGDRIWYRQTIRYTGELADPAPTFIVREIQVDVPAEVVAVTKAQRRIRIRLAYDSVNGPQVYECYVKAENVRPRHDEIEVTAEE